MPNFLYSFILSILIILAFSVSKADVMPYYVGNINTFAIGVYQATNDFNVYEEPSLNSKILYNVKWNSSNYLCEDVSASNLFVVFLPKKDLAFLSVVDENEDGSWIQISYNQKGSNIGWVKKDDDFRFMNWRTFFNIYGRKYGLYYLKDTPDSSKVLYGSNDEDNQKSIGMITLPQTIKLQKVSGNWILAVAYDIDKSQKIGWLKWRNLTGEIYLFPKIK